MVNTKVISIEHLKEVLHKDWLKNPTEYRYFYFPPINIYSHQENDPKPTSSICNDFLKKNQIIWVIPIVIQNNGDKIFLISKENLGLLRYIGSISDSKFLQFSFPHHFICKSFAIFLK
ncbi:hypothetical protein BpHYR1_035942 [Brachionus plicatilis]|uniref:Uncharacterized protein n=1 Tax=Brachionus plicatilis TaxID=10195 RepID=A0A3M7QSR8_BRAPC|nr:hypothetical protein BpHYR1_035942 [Brachionus plicatilis]